MREFSMLLLRVTMGGLTIFWGLDKLVNVEHSLAVTEAFYLGIGASTLFLQGFGVAQTLLGVLIVLGLYRRYAYPPLVLDLAGHGARRLAFDCRPLGLVTGRDQRAVLPVGHHPGGSTGAARIPRRRCVVDGRFAPMMKRGIRACLGRWFASRPCAE